MERESLCRPNTVAQGGHDVCPRRGGQGRAATLRTMLPGQTWLDKLSVVWLVLVIYVAVTPAARTQPAYPGAIIAEIPSPEAKIGGLAYDGTSLWCAGRDPDTIYELDTSDGAIRSSFPSPGGRPSGLHWFEGRLWHVDYETGSIYRIDPGDGTVEAEWPSDTPDPHGIVSHDSRI